MFRTVLIYHKEVESKVVQVKGNIPNPTRRHHPHTCSKLTLNTYLVRYAAQVGSYYYYYYY